MLRKHNPDFWSYMFQISTDVMIIIIIISSRSFCIFRTVTVL